MWATYTHSDATMSSFHYMTEDKWSRLIVTEKNPVMKPNHPSKSTQDYSCGCFKSYQNIPKEKKKKSLVKLPVLKNHGIRMWAVNKNQCFLEQHETLPPRFSFLQALCMCPWRCACQGEIYSNAVQMGRWQWKKRLCGRRNTQGAKDAYCWLVSPGLLHL